MPSSFQDLRVWQDAMKLTLEVYKATNRFPKHELYGLGQQIRRAAVSVPSNIAEGKGHKSNKEFAHFLFHARGSLLELETQMLIAEELQYRSKEDGRGLSELAEKVGRALSGLINSLHESAARTTANSQ
ncbi:MAG TPA: four helix bundle protein [Terriglobales bacterium]|nr:four helix bundle protein [Terriglobales bacterium]